MNFLDFLYLRFYEATFGSTCILKSQMLKITFGATRGSLGSNGSWIFEDLNVQKILLEQLLDVLDLMDQKLGSIGSYLPMNTYFWIKWNS